MNITLEDCIALCGLEADEVAAIAEHEHIPRISAAALAQNLLNERGGPARIRDMLVDDVRGAIRRNDLAHARELLETLRHFLAEHQRELKAQP
jgi:hypothetical protein